MRNIGGAKPHGMEKSTLAWPGRLSMCFAEVEARTPWEPFRVSQGLGVGVGCVGAGRARALRGHRGCAAERARGAGDDLGQHAHGRRGDLLPDGVLVIVWLGPEHVCKIADAGFSRQRVQSYLFEHCRLRVGALRDRGY